MSLASLMMAPSGRGHTGATEPTACDKLLTATPDTLQELQKACHHERGMQGMHEGMNVLGSFLSVIDQGIGEEMDLEAHDPTYLGASDHADHMDHLGKADHALRGTEFAMGFVDSFPAMVERFKGHGSDF